MMWLAGFLLLTTAIAAVRAAYFNGVNDGYGYSQEPRNPGYQKAGRWLRRYGAHRWPELGSRPGLDILRTENDQLRAALQRFVTAAKSWHDFHHGSQTVQCDWICECLAPGERALAGIPEQPQPGEKHA